MRRLWLFSLLVPLLGAALLVWSFLPLRLEPVAPPVSSLPFAAPPPGMSLSALPTSVISSRAAFAFRGGSRR